jgi:Holliday junction resolvase-like predicted endonuclease
MDYFEATVARILEEQGYWVRENVRVALTKEVKRALGNPSMPRCEIDIVAFKPADREIVLFEVKSYLDSYGVQPDDLRRTTREENRYKLLTLLDLQQEISSALLAEYRAQKLILDDVTVRFGLAAGHVQERFDEEVRQIAREKNWVYLGPAEISQAIWKFADLGYENSPFVLTAKLLKRNPPK